MVKFKFNPLSASSTKWSNTLKHFVGKLPTNCLSVFDHIVKLALKGLKVCLLMIYLMGRVRFQVPVNPWWYGALTLRHFDLFYLHQQRVESKIERRNIKSPSYFSAVFYAVLHWIVSSIFFVHTTGFSVYPLKTPENHKLSDVFRRYWWTSYMKWINDNTYVS